MKTTLFSGQARWGDDCAPGARSLENAIKLHKSNDFYGAHRGGRSDGELNTEGSSKHLAGPDGFTKSGQLSGTHNLSNATAALDAKGGNLHAHADWCQWYLGAVLQRREAYLGQDNHRQQDCVRPASVL